ncbi:hypothetical protein FHR36_002904 [Kitasatospora paracochleata]|uniref:DUF4097 domain-containing protein n=2 Tax=Kitasatospora paracochleata TaxID=58354 RepID=A0ABT1IX94_9ACTN|nr:hypothetical protein [Kitasatospora paracochleata]
MMRRAWAWVGVAAVAAGALAGCSIGPQQHREVAYGVDEPVRVLVVQGATGDIEVVGGGSAVKVVERHQYRGKDPEAVHRVADGTLTLSYRCSDCSVGYRVEVPEGTVVQLHNSTGDVRVSGMAGRVEAESSTGQVVAKGLKASSVRLESSTGDVSASFADAPAEVTATSSTGSVRVTVPAGRAYAVEAETGTGDVHIGVERSAAAERRITARTGTGDVTVAGA